MGDEAAELRVDFNPLRIPLERPPEVDGIGGVELVYKLQIGGERQHIELWHDFKLVGTARAGGVQIVVGELETKFMRSVNAVMTGNFADTEDGSLEIDKLWVDRRYRGRGVGSYLLGVALSTAKARGYPRVVAVPNVFDGGDPERLQRFWTTRGFSSGLCRGVPCMSFSHPGAQQ
jgi:GNAT superfamily N-acetyltransferase